MIEYKNLKKRISTKRTFSIKFRVDFLMEVLWLISLKFFVWTFLFSTSYSFDLKSKSKPNVWKAHLIISFFQTRKSINNSNFSTPQFPKQLNFIFQNCKSSHKSIILHSPNKNLTTQVLLKPFFLIPKKAHPAFEAQDTENETYLHNKKRRENFNDKQNPSLATQIVTLSKNPIPSSPLEDWSPHNLPSEYPLKIHLPLCKTVFT